MHVKNALNFIHFKIHRCAVQRSKINETGHIKNFSLQDSLVPYYTMHIN